MKPEKCPKCKNDWVKNYVEDNIKMKKCLNCGAKFTHNFKYHLIELK